MDQLETRLSAGVAAACRADDLEHLGNLLADYGSLAQWVEAVGAAEVSQSS